MYRDLVQWENIRKLVLKEGKSQRDVSRTTGISRKTIQKSSCLKPLIIMALKAF